MSIEKFPIFSVLIDLIAFLIPAALVSDKYSTYFWGLVGIDVLVLTLGFVYYLSKKNSKRVIEQILNDNKVVTGLCWALGAVAWALGADWVGFGIWSMVAVSFFFLGLRKKLSSK